MDAFKFLREQITAAIPAEFKSLSELAARANVNQPNLSMFMRGERRSMNLETAWRLMNTLGLEVQRKTIPTPEYNPPTIRRTGEHSPVEYVQGPHIVEVGVYGMVEAGRMGLEIFELAPSRLIPILQRYYQENLVALEVDGKSMEPTIRKGAVIGVVPVAGDLVEGEMYLVKLPHFGALVKRVYMGKGKLLLKSDNQDFDPLELDYEGHELNTILLGRVKWIWQDV